ncbi:hypothetical protein [Microbacterium candidum]|uniref:Transposase n=1 Tax=Microbacterium candidum TaxID=3041922 RepID=A0ABT7MW10_9MICO|nr:hypothetical protein [Microbacterium sp. ASV49]MDL9978634.1 hypothetical protein [Microbacterium sp. ASV49]
MSKAYIDPDEWSESFTPSAINTLRERCKEAANTLRARGTQPTELAAVDEVVTVPRSFMGFNRRPEYRRERRVLLWGWPLREVQTLMGTSGNEWFRWTVTAALGVDGNLYRVELHREQRNGVPTSDDGKVTVSLLADTEFDLFEVVDPENFRNTGPIGYWNRFPGHLGNMVDTLLA